MVIDFRCRPPIKKGYPMPRERLEMLTKKYGVTISEAYEKGSMDLFKEEMKAAGIDRVVICGRPPTKTFGAESAVTNEEVAEYVSKDKEHFSGIGTVDVTDMPAAVEGVAKAKSLGLVAVSFEPTTLAQPMYCDDQRLMPLYQACTDQDLMMMINLSGALGPDLSYSDPAHVLNVARKFPRMRLAISHGCYPWAELACGVAFYAPNVYLMPDIYLTLGYPATEHYIQAANTFLQDRMLFATAYPSVPLSTSVERTRGLPFRSAEVMEKYLHGNAAKLLGVG